MPSKSKTNPDNLSENANFVLKHRIAGAGFLLFFGALVLPWLLGPPSEALKVASISPSVAPQGSNTLDEPVKTPSEQQNVIPNQEQVYISKITPLDRSGSEKTEVVDSESSNTKPPAKRPTSSDEGSSLLVEESSTEAKGSSTTAKGSSKTEVAAEKTKVPDSANAPNKINNKTTTAAPKPRVDVGWVVQVGVFTDKRGAVKVVEDLRAKGFNPSTSIVDTNRGKATGTRIWLGPYAQRVEAAKAKSLLTDKTGEAGFIRAYP